MGLGALVEQFTILDWPQRDLLETAPAILRLPYEPVTDNMRDEVRELQPLALIPPYDPENWKFNTRSAVLIRGHFPTVRIMVAMPGKDHHAVRRNISSLQADGFDAFALPEMMGTTATGAIAGFWESSNILSVRVWYHIAGGSRGPIAEVKGFWSWGVECL